MKDNKHIKRFNESDENLNISGVRGSKIKRGDKVEITNKNQQFLKLYYKLSNTDKFYTLSAAVLNYKNLKMAKTMLLEELRKDLENLKFLNKPGTTTEFGYKYTGYNSANTNIWENIDKVKIPNLIKV